MLTGITIYVTCSPETLIFIFLKTYYDLEIII